MNRRNLSILTGPRTGNDGPGSVSTWIGALFLLPCLCTPALAQHPAPPSSSTSVKALLETARMQARQRSHADALETLRKARALAPNSEDVLSGFARMALSTGAVTPALLTLQALTRMCPREGEYRYLLGVGLMQAGDYVAATDSLAEADRLEPNKPLTLIAQGVALNNRKMFAEAKPLLLRGLELEPDSVDAVAALSEAEEGLGEDAAAEQHATRALERTPGHATANLVMGLLAMKQGRYSEARDAFRRSLATLPSVPKTHYQLSLAYARLGDAVNAEKEVELYRKAVKDMADRLDAVRAETGLPSQGGMKR